MDGIRESRRELGKGVEEGEEGRKVGRKEGKEGWNFRFSWPIFE
jgi:hypothetical protein